ncbi:N(4)-(Beta-N-acetylglucosaminyl)-L-asparaginase [Venturia canescens]|uniref:N(4)-(Beta-N-acetylglucosaminyl)-L-asparaginase n=1 Tax=Venturia canescens TaxID=32260 RepID=UPI001C9C4E5B|nr:N(4)-(Beta-N-acetylglucosaminyl)-L-asparaginase [Venturia canescens]
MKLISLAYFLSLLVYELNTSFAYKASKVLPLVVITWNYQNATQTAWETLYHQKRSAVDAIEESGSLCERMQCRKTVGFGGSPDECGDTTLDAMIMDGVTMDVGAVGGIRNIKSAISVARKVLENTKHSLLVASGATKFAEGFGFKKESLQTNESLQMWTDWKTNNCQPNFWKNVNPDPTKSCGPYLPAKKYGKSENTLDNYPHSNENNHDTIGIIAIDRKGNVAAGTSTNGAKNKIKGRVGDSPIAGAGAYADQEVGAAAGTGDGDIMMRFLPSFLAVEEMRRGAEPADAAATAIKRIAKHYPTFTGGVIALSINGSYGAACNGIRSFPYYVSNPLLGKPTLMAVRCNEQTDND